MSEVNGSRAETLAALEALAAPEAPRAVDVGGGHIVYLRRLTAADILPLDEGSRVAGLQVIALALADRHGEQLFPPDRLADGVALVGRWPTRVMQALDPIMQEMNSFAGLVGDARQD